MPHDNDHFAAELLATADALRHARGQVRLLMENNDPAVTLDSAGFTVIFYGLGVAQELETIARRLGKDGPGND